MQHRPKRSLGQNFLRDGSVSERIVEALDLASGEHIIEIGPGQGALTERLIASGAVVTAVELDREFVPALRERFSDASNFSVVEADALNVEFASFCPRSVRTAAQSTKLVANLPYNISTPILQRLIAQRESFSRLVLMFQREVVDRITAPAGGRERGYLSVIAEMGFDIERLFDVSPGAFFPVPKVWSSVIRLTPKQKLAGEDDLANLVSIGFRHRRKTLLNNFQGLFPHAADALAAADIPANRRAQTLTLEEWRQLRVALAK
jgi:16S rRNA (adenine1518-N6/adenine1519-N6)-dimethyltransferase